MAGPEKEQPKIMTTPLPTILWEIEDWIRRVEAATKKADEAAAGAREAGIEAGKAAGEARLAGEKAAGEAARVAGDKIRDLQSLLSGDIAEIRRIAEEALAIAKIARDFAKRLDELDVATRNALIEVREKVMGR